MEEEFVRRNTDCVYFLASPLTCKKGFECEYRHSETARLNPRDCWYWLAGTCWNPSCPFRHPPLDGLTETASEAAVTHQQGVAPANKTGVPCYFYYNSFCNKGDSCPFLHGPADKKPSGKFSKMVSSVIDSSLEEKTSVAADLGPAPAVTCEIKAALAGTREIKAAPAETREIKVAPAIAKPAKVIPEKDPHNLTYSNVVEQSASPQLSDSPGEEADVMRPNSMIRREASPQSTDQSTENQVEHFGQEDWLESSPGFDVLVNDRSEELEHEAAAAYLEQLDEEYQVHNHQNFSLEYEDNVEYDPAYPDIKISFPQEMRNFYGQDHEDICNPMRNFRACESESVVDNNWKQKRKFSPAGLTCIDRSDTDLRDYLKRRRVFDVDYPTYSDYREQPRVVDGGRLHGRLASKVEMYSTGSQILHKTRMGDNTSLDKMKTRQMHISKPRPNRSKSRRQGKKQNVLSEISGKKTVRKHGPYTEESSVFTRPKTLAEIKEEKKKAIQVGFSQSD